VIKLNVVFRLNEGRDRELINHIQEIKAIHNTKNRSKALRIILQRSLEQDQLKTRIEKIENNQLKLMNYLNDLKEVSDKNNKSLNSLLQGLYNIFNQNNINFSQQEFSNPFDFKTETKKKKKEEKENEVEVDNDQYQNILNNISNNPRY
jgi:thioester reductase-like protein